MEVEARRGVEGLILPPKATSTALGLPAMLVRPRDSALASPFAAPPPSLMTAIEEDTAKDPPPRAGGGVRDLPLSPALFTSMMLVEAASSLLG